ncbi:MAG: hypothetical protein WBD20_21440 [Pirellulaceae bacterium]
MDHEDYCCLGKLKEAMQSMRGKKQKRPHQIDRSPTGLLDPLNLAFEQHTGHKVLMPAATNHCVAMW